MRTVPIERMQRSEFMVRILVDNEPEHQPEAAAGELPQIEDEEVPRAAAAIFQGQIPITETNDMKVYTYQINVKGNLLSRIIWGVFGWLERRGL